MLRDCIQYRDICLAGLVCLCTISLAPAVDRSWDNASGGYFDVSTNWSTSVRPDITGIDTAIFNIAGTYDVRFDATTYSIYGGAPVVNDLDVYSGNVSFVTTGTPRRSLQVAGSGGNQSVAINSSGTLNLGDPASASRSFQLIADNYFLIVSGNLNVYEGSRVDAGNFLDIAASGGTATLLVVGAGAEATAEGTNWWGRHGGTANVTFTDSATGSFGYVDLAGGTDANTRAMVEVSDAAQLETGSLELASDGASGAFAGLTVETNGASLTQAGASTLMVGHATLGSALITVEDDGTFNTGTGTTTINSRGTIRMNSGGNWNANGNINIDGGWLDRNTGGTFNLAAGKEVTIQNGGFFTFEGSYNLVDGSTFNIFTGGTMDFSSYLDIGDNGTNGTLNVDGSGSSATFATTTVSFWGDQGGTAIVTVSDQASLELAALDAARSAASGTTATIDVLTDADMILNGYLSLSDAGGAATSGTITIDGGGSTLTQNSTADNTIGHATSGTARVTVRNDGTFTTGTGTTTVRKTGAINIETGGTLNANGNVVIDGGLLHRNNGTTFDLATGLSLTVQNDGEFIYDGSYDLDFGHTFNSQSGGKMSFGSYLDIGDGAGDGTLIVDGPNSLVNVGGSVVSYWGALGDTAMVVISNGGAVDVGSLELARSATAGTTAIVNVLSGARLSINGRLEMVKAGGASTSALLTVAGMDSLAEQNSAADNILGFTSGGPANITVRNFGSLRLGTGVTYVNPTATIELNSGGVLTTHGPIDMNGGAFNFLGGTLHASTFNGNLVNQGGTLAPGDSAGSTLINGDYTQQSAAALEIQVGGTTPVAGHDLVSVTGNVILDGELELYVIDGFPPAATDMFTVLNSSNIFNVFSNVLTGQRLGTLDGFGSFLVHYGAGSLYASNQIWLTDFLLTGDYNHNGVVDAADYTVWRDTLGATGGAPYAAGDGDGDGDVDDADYLAWKSHFGMAVGSGSSANATVPEPTTLALVLMATVLLGARPRRRGQVTLL